MLMATNGLDSSIGIDSSILCDVGSLDVQREVVGPVTGSDGIEGRRVLPESFAVDPQVGENTFDEQSRFERGQTFYEKKWIVSVLGSSLSLSEVPGAAIVSRGHEEEIALNPFKPAQV